VTAVDPQLSAEEVWAEAFGDFDPDTIQPSQLSLERLAATLAVVREQLAPMAKLKKLEGDLEAAIGLLMDTPAATAGPWTVKRHRGKGSGKWDSPGVFNALVRRANLDRETGEVLPEPDLRAAIELLRACLPLTDSLGWRVTALVEQAGLDPDEWRTFGRGPWHVDVDLDTETTNTTPGGDT
jgi:hypothetical protein